MSLKRKYHFIYKTICLVNNKYYIGLHSTDNLKDGYLGSGKVLKRSLNKYGKEFHSFEIIEFSLDRSSLKIREHEIVNDLLLKDPMCMNLVMGGGDGAMMWDLENPEHIEKLSNWQSAGVKVFQKKIKNDPILKEQYRKRKSELNIKMWSEGKFDNKPPTWSGKTHTIESKIKIGQSNSIKQKGENNSQFGTCWINKDGTNKKIDKSFLITYISDGWIQGRIGKPLK